MFQHPQLAKNSVSHFTGEMYAIFGPFLPGDMIRDITVEGFYRSTITTDPINGLLLVNVYACISDTSTFAQGQSGRLLVNSYNAHPYSAGILTYTDGFTTTLKQFGEFHNTIPLEFLCSQQEQIIMVSVTNDNVTILDNLGIKLGTDLYSNPLRDTWPRIPQQR